MPIQRAKPRFSEIKNTDNVIGSSQLDLTANYAFTGTVTGMGTDLILDESFGSFAGAGSVAAYDISSTYITSTYDTYFLEGTFRPSSDNKYVQMQTFVGGVVQTGDVYASEGQYAPGGHSSNNNTGSSLFIQQFGSGGDAGEGTTLQMTIQNVNSTDVPFTISGFCSHINTDPNQGGTLFTGQMIHANRADVVNGIRFKMHSGNIHGGHVRLYGYKT